MIYEISMFELAKNLKSEYDIELNGSNTITKLAVFVSSLCEGISNIKNISKHKDVGNIIEILNSFAIRVVQDKNLIIVDGRDISEWQQPNNVVNIHSSLDVLKYLVSIVSFRNFRVFITGDDDFISNNSINLEHLENNNFIFRDSGNHLPVVLLGDYKPSRNTFKIKTTLEKHCVLLNSIVSKKNYFLTECGIRNEYLENILGFYGAEIKENLFESRMFLVGNVVKCKELSITNVGKGITAKDFVVPIDINEAVYTIFVGLLLDLEKFNIKNVSVNEFNGEILKMLIENGIDLELKNQRISNGLKTVDLVVKKSKLKMLPISKSKLLKILDLYPFIILLNVIKKNELRILGLKELKIQEKSNYNFLADFLKSIDVSLEEDGDVLVLNNDNVSYNNIDEIRIEEYSNIDDKVFLAIYLANIIFNKRIRNNGNVVDLTNIFPNIHNLFNQLNIKVKDD
ncbi:MAG: hypothetical protein LBS34_03605 [Rickettsiales bacterium]|jgi:5-enolpyruvylshikimate-3-phosphate synthase|nr:hypothetical protein [Rickettsiales bacterium]